MVSKLGLLCYATHDMLFSRVSFTHTRIRIDGTWEEVQYVCVYCTTNIVRKYFRKYLRGYSTSVLYILLICGFKTQAFMFTRSPYISRYKVVMYIEIYLRKSCGNTPGNIVLLPEVFIERVRVR